MGLDDFGNPIGDVESDTHISEVSTPETLWALMMVRLDSKEIAGCMQGKTDEERRAIVEWLDHFIQNHPYAEKDRIEQKAKDLRSELLDQGI